MWGGPMMGWGNPGYMMGQGGGYGRGMWRNPDAPGRGRFTMIDADQDGRVSAEEASSAADQVFTAMDANDDGQLTREEYMAVRMGPQNGWNADRQAARQEAKSGRFDTMDTEKDGTVSRAEFMAGAKAHFEAADADHDGTVTPWEFRRRAWN